MGLLKPSRFIRSIRSEPGTNVMILGWAAGINAARVIGFGYLTRIAQTDPVQLSSC